MKILLLWRKKEEEEEILKSRVIEFGPLNCIDEVSFNLTRSTLKFQWFQRLSQSSIIFFHLETSATGPLINHA